MTDAHTRPLVVMCAQSGERDVVPGTYALALGVAFLAGAFFLGAAFFAAGFLGAAFLVGVCMAKGCVMMGEEGVNTWPADGRQHKHCAQLMHKMLVQEL